MYVSIAETLERQPRAGALGWEVGMSPDSPSLGTCPQSPGPQGSDNPWCEAEDSCA